MASELERLQGRLRKHFAPRLDLDRWWPHRSRWEIVVGAILVRNTGWANVERALAALRQAGRLSLARMRGLEEGELERLIRPAGCWREKAACLRGFTGWLDAAHQGRLERALRQPTAGLRRELLGLRGIGPETADAILLYAGGHARFVADAYTRRILSRHGLVPAGIGYEELAAWGAAALGGPEARELRHLHALTVETAKAWCHKRDPDCRGCPLGPLPPPGALPLA